MDKSFMMADVSSLKC